jgi:hypothetical protein
MMRKISILVLVVILTACAPDVRPAPTSTPFLTHSFAATPTASVIPILETGLPPKATITPDAAQAKLQAEIKNVIQAYFDLRYRALSVSPPDNFQKNGFGTLVSDGPDARDFLATEMAKLAVERMHLELNKYTYAKYEYTLKYKEIRIDPSAQTAAISLIEYFEIICEKAVESNPVEPHACAIGSLNHEFVFHNEQGTWKIVSDIYKDAWWRQFRKPGATTDEILRMIDIEMRSLDAKASPTP